MISFPHHALCRHHNLIPLTGRTCSIFIVGLSYPSPATIDKSKGPLSQQKVDKAASMSIYAYSTHPPADMKILPPLPESDEHESYETVPEYPDDGDGNLISRAETETLQSVPDTTRSAGGDSSLPSPYGVGDGLKLPLKARVVQGSSVSAKERLWNIESVAMGDGIVDGNGKCLKKGLMYGCVGLSGSVEGAIR